MLESNLCLVESIEGDDDGAFRLHLSRGYTLSVWLELPDSASSDETDCVQWRYLPKEEKQEHLVLTLQGISA